MGLLDFVESLNPFRFVSDAMESTSDSLGLSRHGRDQVVNYENQLALMNEENAMNRENFNYQFAASNSEFDRRYNRYESPAAQVGQLAAAGLNPSAMVQKGGAGFAVQGQMQPFIPSPTGIVAPSSPAPGSSDGAHYLDAASRMKLSSAQRQEILDLLKGRIREQDDAHEMSLLINANQKFLNFLQLTYGEDERATKLANLASEGLLLYMRHKESEMNAKFLEAQTILADDEHVKNKDFLPTLRLYLEALVQSTRAKASADWSQADYYSSLAETENSLREFKYNLLKNENQLSDETLRSEIDKVINECKASEYIPENAKVALELAKKENNLYYAKEIIGIITDGIGMAMYAKTGGRIASAMEIRNKIQERIFDYNKENGVSETIVDRFGPNGKVKERTHSYSRKRPKKGR